MKEKNKSRDYYGKKASFIGLCLNCLLAVGKIVVGAIFGFISVVADGMRRGKKDKYINSVQKELFKVFEEPMRSMTVSQGALLMKLIDREIGKTSFQIIKDYKNGIAAGFWQGIAKLFGSDMKKPYDPEGDDKQTEELVKLWKEGEFDLLYFAIFMKEPPQANIPEQYR